MSKEDFSGKNVLVRADFNVELDEREDVREKYKIAAARKTVDRLLAQGAHVALVTHFGRPTHTTVGNTTNTPEREGNEVYSVQKIADDVERILGVSVRFLEQCIGPSVREALATIVPTNREVVLLENVRLYPGEEKNDEEFSKALAASFDVFINDAFSVCHRDQASVTGITAFLPSYAGLHLLEEVEKLTQALEHPEHPAIAIVGGSKIETKLPVLKAFESRYDTVLVGSRIALEAQAANMQFSDKVVLPEDYAEGNLDIGPRTIERFKQIIAGSKTVIWNGPLGKFEEAPFEKGTKSILEAVIESEAFSVIGGGESVQMLEEWGVFEKIGFVSTGGGAMLDFLGGVSMPGLEKLKK